MNPILLISCVLCSLLIGVIANVNLEIPVKRFEYTYSFKPPYLAQRDGSVPFFEYTGNAIASEENLRITPSLKSQKGSVWTKTPTNFEWWEVEILFRVTGRGRIGADGLGFWFSHQKGSEGPVFGSSDQWNGLGIFFDSFDNDNKHNNPYIMAMVNDGTKQYDHHNDGSTQQLAGCLRDFRNKPFPIRARIQYFKNVLSLMIHNGMSNNEHDFEMCLRVENVILPSRGYFGISAATGGLADDHDIQKFLTWSMTSTYDEGLGLPVQIPSEDQKRFEKEFETYQQELDRKKQEYIKEHPEAKDKDEEDWFEEEQIRELRQIFQGQSDLRVLVQSLSKKLDEIVGRQETTISLVNSIQNSGILGQQQVPPPAGMPAQAASPMHRHEVDNLLASSRELVASTREIKNLLTSLSAKQDQLSSRPPNYGMTDYTSNFNEIRDSVNGVKRDMSMVSQRVLNPPPPPPPAPQIQCPTVNCATTTVLIVGGCIQIAILLGYAIFQNRKETQQKKFY